MSDSYKSPRELAAAIVANLFTSRAAIEAGIAFLIADLDFNLWVKEGKYGPRSDFNVKGLDSWMSFLYDSEEIYKEATEAWTKFERSLVPDIRAQEAGGDPSENERLFVESLRSAKSRLDELAIRSGRLSE